ncbi:DUF6894 family protein [Bosea sp. TAF32]|uniref:DUF6894 family protein n=1 Tax=Bosea sp. TAF32 TaxID=3237482 RepID=UPI003F90B551
MPMYRFITNSGGSHFVDLDLPDDKAARQEARTAFAEAAHDALTETDNCEITMLVQAGERPVYRGRISFESADVTDSARTRSGT